LRGTQEEMVIIDTPGLGDPKGNDTQNIADMIDYLRQAQFVNAFIVVFNG
jgi:predicted GTPase